MVASQKFGTGALVAAAALSMTLTGCSAAKTVTETTAVTKSAAPAGAKAGAVNDAGISPKDLPNPPALKVDTIQGAVKDWKMDGTCDYALGDKKVTGTLTSSAKEPMDYVITINWVHGSDVMGRAVKLVEKAEPGKAMKVELTTKLTKAADGCTVNVVRGAKA